jgi:hypothetical protein
VSEIMGDPEILAVIARLPWRRPRAKDRWGKPQIPHEHVVRTEAIETDYVTLFNAIRAARSSNITAAARSATSTPATTGNIGR